MTEGPPYRDYAEPDWPPPVPAGLPPAPRPGHGTVFVTAWRDGTWSASWQDGPGVADVEGDRDAVLAWARSRDAVTVLVFSDTVRDYVPLREDGDA